MNKIKIKNAIHDIACTPTQFLSQCETLAQDIKEKNPFNAAMDYQRINLLVEIAKKYLAVKE